MTNLNFFALIPLMTTTTAWDVLISVSSFATGIGLNESVIKNKWWRSISLPEGVQVLLVHAYVNVHSLLWRFKALVNNKFLVAAISWINFTGMV